MTIAFLSLFFGLISGPYPVELTIDGSAAAVEIVVDGRPAGRLPGPPWKGTINFGKSLLPHGIVVRALDADGHELARAEEWVNLPHPLSKAEIVLETGGSAPPKAAKVVWTNLKGEKPLSVSLTFDGLPVALDAGGHAALPAHDTSSIHMLSAEVQFPAGETVHRDLAYGGGFGSEVSTELTGIPVRALAGEVPAAAKLDGWLTAQGKPLSVAAVENGPGELYVVRAPSAPETREKLRLTGKTQSYIRYQLPLGKEDGIRFIVPSPKRVAGSGERSDLFDITAEMEPGTGGLLWALTTFGAPQRGERFMASQPRQELRIADAVAVAGQQAMAQNRRRAVLLILSGDEKDASEYDPATVRRYLSALRVPLYVWTLGAPGPTAAAWGTSENIFVASNLYRAAEELQRQLDSQRIVMVDGRHLPQSIALSPAAAGLQLAGAGTP
jgi:hypothetical protein